MTDVDEQAGTPLLAVDATAESDRSRPQPTGRPYPWGIATIIVIVLLAAAVWATTSREGDVVATGPTGGEPPSPLFDDVEQLTAMPLPDGWTRCGGGRSGRPDAEADWWAQTFGPVADGRCEPLITVTQVPGDAYLVEDDIAFDEVKIGRADAMRWVDEQAGSVTLFTWAAFQNLIVEACCGADALAHLDEVALAALDGTRDEVPSHCTAPESDLALEDEVDAHFGAQGRMYDRDGCPLRRDIATMRTEPPHHHCWPNLTTLVIGTPVGTSYAESGARAYRRDADGVLDPAEGPDPRLDLDAALPPTAVDTGLSRGGQTLWLDPTDDSRAFLVSDDHVEAWPQDREERMCA